MAMDVKRISVTDEELDFLHGSVQGVLYDLINVLGPSSVIFQPRNFRSEFAYISGAHNTTRKVKIILQSFSI